MAFTFRKRENADKLGSEQEAPRTDGTGKGGAPSVSLGELAAHTVHKAVHYPNVSVGVVLLPPRYAQARMARRFAQISVVIGTLAISALAIGSGFVWRQTQELTVQRDIAHGRVVTLQSQVDSLKEFSDQAEQLAQINDNLIRVMSAEVSWAKVLNDLAMTVPTTTALDHFEASVDLQAARAAAALYVPDNPDDGTEDQPTIPIGTVSISGYSINRYSPGVEAVLTQFMGVQSYASVFMPTTTREEVTDGEVVVNDADLQFDGKYGFSLQIGLSPAALTGRYRQGLPEIGGSS